MCDLPWDENKSQEQSPLREREDSLRKKGSTRKTWEKTVTQLTERFHWYNRLHVWGDVRGTAESHGVLSQRNSIIFLDVKSRQYRFALSNVVAASNMWLFTFTYNDTENSVSQSPWSHLYNGYRGYHIGQSRISIITESSARQL